MRKDGKHISVTHKTYERLRTQAEREDVSIPFLIDCAVAQALNLEPPKPRRRRIS